MRYAAMLSGLVLISSLADAQDKKEVPKELAPFQGTWKIVKAEFEGKAPDKNPADVRFLFKGDTMSVKEGPGAPEEGKFTVDSTKNPAEIDLTSAKGEKILGIYKFEKDGKLSLCFSKGKSAVRPKSFDTKKTMAGLLVLQKVKK
ncbi:MAG TPA: TIGR03067 domain-containing protein [Gemmata sp.]|nr:TIGR03067 domain-containing protein [Gemmata sp.]